MITLAVIHFIINFELVQNTNLIEQSWINLINWYILIITMSTGFSLLIWLAFFMGQETAKDLEKFLLKNLTTACFLSILVLWVYWLEGKLDKNFTLTAIGAILVFWYWYKTYERDKEIEALIHYWKEYNIAVNDIPEKGIWGLLNEWYTQYFLYNKGYLKDDYWIELEYWIKKDLLEILLVEYDAYISNKDQYLSDEYQKVIDYISRSSALSVFDPKKLTLANKFLPYFKHVITEVIWLIKELKDYKKDNTYQWFEIYTK